MSQQRTPTYLEEINHVWGEIFLKECEKLAKSEPWLDDEELEAKAEERTNHYIYLWHKDRLPSYRHLHQWRGDMQK